MRRRKVEGRGAATLDTEVKTVTVVKVTSMQRPKGRKGFWGKFGKKEIPLFQENFAIQFKEQQAGQSGVHLCCKY